jgi:hypothetical protein
MWQMEAVDHQRHTAAKDGTGDVGEHNDGAAQDIAVDITRSHGAIDPRDARTPLTELCELRRRLSPWSWFVAAGDPMTG